jgi:hypothetical protein
MISFYLLMVGKKDGFLVEVVGRGVVVVMSGILGTL